jgi:hypothetical protein
MCLNGATTLRALILSLAILFCPGLLSNSAQITTTGSVEGVVIDLQGKPISDVNVYALPEADMRRLAASATTDSTGKFILQFLPPGGYFVYAYKESDGYPRAFFRFFTNPGSQLPVEAKVEAGKSTMGVTLKLGAKSAYLKFNLTDENGNHVPAGLVFTRVDQQGDLQTGTTGDDTMLIPTVPFRLMIQASGYPPWHFGGANYAGKAGLITLKSGQTLTLNVRLRKK